MEKKAKDIFQWLCVWLCISIGIYPFLLSAQTSDSLELKTLIISAEKTSGIPALKTIEFDSTVLGLSQTQNLGRTLESFSAVSIKSYGSPGIQLSLIHI